MTNGSCLGWKKEGKKAIVRLLGEVGMFELFDPIIL